MLGGCGEAGILPFSGGWIVHTQVGMRMKCGRKRWGSQGWRTRCLREVDRGINPGQRSWRLPEGPGSGRKLDCRRARGKQTKRELRIGVLSEAITSRFPFIKSALLMFWFL